MDIKYNQKLKLVTNNSQITKAIKNCPLIIGIGPSAWPRIIPSMFFPKYKIISYSDCQDNDYINDFGVEVFSLRKKDPNMEITPITPGRILSTKVAKDYLASQKEPFTFLIYKSMGTFEKVCEENGWNFVGNKREVREKYEDKRIFKETLKEIGIQAIPGENIPINELTTKVFLNYQKKLGKQKLVLQIAEATWGGGVGTLFIDNPKDLHFFYERVEELKKNLEGKKKKIETVNIAPYIDGISVSIACCTTKYGVLTGCVQNQIIDIPEVGAKLPSRSGIYAGHDWAYFHYPKEIQEQAVGIARRFGDYLYKNGFKGVFGLDLIIEEEKKVWPVECNPRETDAFPLICMLQMERGLIPMTVFHILEHLGVDYNIDFDEVDGNYKQDFNASQILLYNPLDESAVDRGILKAGVYKVENGKLVFLRPGFLFSDLKGENEYLYTEGVEKESNNPYKPHGRMVRLIKKGGVLVDKSKLNEKVKEVVDLVYKEFKLVPIKNGLVNEEGLNVLYTDTLAEVNLSQDLVKADIINVVVKNKSGFRRPVDIAWRKSILNNTPIIDQIYSKRARKQLKSDINKMSQLGVEIKKISEIDNEIFEKWLDLYTKIISEKEKGEVIVKKDWFEKKKEKGKKVGAILAYENGVLIGGGLFFDVNGILCEGYGISEKITGLSGGLSQLIDYYFLNFAKENKYSEVSFGQDTNFYGYDLSAGLINYKAKFGFSPIVAKKTYFVNTLFLNFDKFENNIMFFSQEEKGLVLNVITKDSNFDKTTVYLPQGVAEIRVFNKDDIVTKDRK